jgi:protein SCO1
VNPSRLAFAQAALVLLLLLVSAPVMAQAKTERLHGIVLAVTPKTGQAVVRHDPFGGMPSMSMPFRIEPRERAAELLPGSEIDATVDTSTEPWTLRDVTTTVTQAVTAPAVPRAAPLRLGDEVPDTPFVDQTGRPFRFSMLRGDDVVLAFIFTRCQDSQMCPLISAHFNQLQRTMGARNLHLVEVTLDPSYDRPPVLQRYARTFGADPKHWTLAVGAAQSTLDFAARFGISAYPDPNAGIIHTENTVEIDAAGRIRNMIPDAEWQPPEILADVDAIGRSPDPIARLAGFGPMTDLAAGLLVVCALVYLAARLARRFVKAG